MIVEYHQPHTLHEALKLLARPHPRTVALGGGTILNQPGARGEEPLAVVDIQMLGLSSVARSGNMLRVGAGVTLQALVDGLDAAQVNGAALGEAIRREASYNLRQTATLAGTLVGADGRSSLTTALLALDANLDVLDLKGSQTIGLAELYLNADLPRRTEQGDQTGHGQARRWAGKLITQVDVPINVSLHCEYVARTPQDLPLLIVAVAQWPSGRTRIALGGYGPAPLLAMDGPEPGGAEIAAAEAYRHAGDAWATAAYRSAVAGKLAGRCLAAFGQAEERTI